MYFTLKNEKVDPRQDYLFLSNTSLVVQILTCCELSLNFNFCCYLRPGKMDEKNPGRNEVFCYAAASNSNLKTVRPEPIT